MVVLLVSDDIDMGIQAVGGEAALRRAEVLRDIDGSAVAAEDQLAVQSVGRQVAPDGTVGLPLEDALIQALLHQTEPSASRKKTPWSKPFWTSSLPRR